MDRAVAGADLCVVIQDSVRAREWTGSSRAHLPPEFRTETSRTVDEVTGSLAFGLFRRALGLVDVMTR